jgi:hypothetical protein
MTIDTKALRALLGTVPLHGCLCGLCGKLGPEQVTKLLDEIEALRADVRSYEVLLHEADERLDAARASIEAKGDALKLAEAQLDDQAGWSGAAGNWPLQDALIAVRKALQVKP